MKPKFDKHMRFVKPVKPDRSLVKLEQEDPALAELTKIVLFGMAEFVHTTAQSFRVSPGLERVDELSRDAYDAGIYHVLWTPDRQMAVALIWNKEAKRYFAFGLPAKQPPHLACPVLFCRIGDHLEILNRPPECDEPDAGPA